MAYKKHEGYLDPTSGQAMQNTQWEELQQLRETRSEDCTH